MFACYPVPILSSDIERMHFDDRLLRRWTKQTSHVKIGVDFFKIVDQTKFNSCYQLGWIGLPKVLLCWQFSSQKVLYVLVNETARKIHSTTGDASKEVPSRPSLVLLLTLLCDNI
ncbi:hypothetical protein POTOM_016143 [Populus tomentosa]|uniref:Uncharacterized protein n=1 Tax=Populus tomentosa TaxID=118781 RepID=A0A8X8A8G0_POPTO|nr:hypothetical protein POTOM_016143 [Populus tomentosa]